MTVEQVSRAASAVQKDPLLGGSHTERTLKFKSDDKKDDEEEAPTPKADRSWLVDLGIWLAESGRLLVWLLGALALAMLVVGARRWFFVHGGLASRTKVVLPSHVRDLDIRPESLPEDIAGTARALWQRGEHRAALSLLYRGALSRLVHEHAVPIRAANTEGDCVVLASRSLSGEASGFFQGLVQAWLLTVYGARTPDDAQVMSLCDRFDAQLPRKARTEAAA
ncbi:DUF4129 domain-containing protein [Albitalea terrae]|uniref:DUF4129 domain-containing protein n=1 Tax=Piscinibacter terrae TaxID=2496871 RepID=A0A3N7HWR3_9BURK|nr:DUF4129 domain-containing protein [Albitalea terrae]